MSKKGVRPVTKSAAYGGLGTALIVVLLLGSSLLPFMEYTIPAACAIVVFYLCMECGQKTALGSYLASAFLGLILLPNKEAVMLFALFFGYYPVLRQFLLKYSYGKHRLLQKAVGFAVFNLSMVATYFFLIKLFGLDQLWEELNMGMQYGAFVLLAVGNFAFWLFDLLLLRFEQLYFAKKMGMRIEFGGFLARLMRQIRKK